MVKHLGDINLYRIGDRSEPHLVNASMRLMMAFETAKVEGEDVSWKGDDEL